MKLDLLIYGEKLKIKILDGKSMVWDIIRSKWVVLTPEEMVRMCFVQYLIHDRKISRNKIAIEREIQVSEKKKRFDLLVYNDHTFPFIAVECKSPDIVLDEKVISQLVRYNQVLDCTYLWIVNGVEGRIFKKEDNEYWKEVKSMPI